ncbi:MAG: DUF4384 domain-containing protein [Calditrichaeota bacterium]|nr:MAG: DUF4384 domain-containing protein [Calditrichota bacterium]
MNLNRTILLLVILFTSNLLSQNHGKWVIGVGKVLISENLTIAEARHLARTRARNNAIEKALGVTVTAEQFLQKFELSRQSGDILEAGDSFINFIRESRRGKILEQGTWQEKDTVLVYGESSLIQKIVRNRFLVVPEEKQADPSFQLKFIMGKDKYKAGEPIQFEIEATLDCYVTIFNLASNDSVYLIFPNVIEPTHKLMAHQRRRIPGSNYTLVASLPEGKDAAVEYFIAVATKDPVTFRVGDIIKPGGSYTETLKTGLNEVWRWIAEIDADRRVESIKAFKIFR